MTVENAQGGGRFYDGKVIVILGPTASGKTGVAIEIAKEIEQLGAAGGLDALGAEIISADSRTIFRGMDVGTAKPTMEERAEVPHWGFDLVEPGERFTVADWKEYALKKIAEIRARGNVPMIVGGTGLYIDALVYDYQFSDDAKQTQNDRQEICSEYLLVGIKWSPEDLRARIVQRANNLFNDELFEETKKLVSLYNWNTQAMKSNIYQFAWGYLEEKYSLEEAIQLSVYDDWHLAKRQMTWFKRNTEISWLSLNEVKDFVINKLNGD